MNGRGDVIACRERVTVAVAVLELLTAERRLSGESASVTVLTKAEDALAIAARDLTEAVGGLPQQQRPKGWAQ